MPTPPTLATARLVLRPWRDGDLAPFAALNADPDVMEHFPGPLTEAQATALAQGMREDMDERGFGLWAAELPGVAPFIGFIGLSLPDFNAHFLPPGRRVVEVGWRLAKEHWGKGYASEGAREALRFGFEDLGLAEIVSFTTTTNQRSQAVMRRLGMTHDPGDDFDHPGIPPGHRLRRHVLYRMGRAAWRRLMGKSYFVCRWYHDHPDQPVDLYSELDAERYELRKVDVFKDGHGEIAGPGIEMGSTFLSPEPWPPIEEIAADPQFEPQEISKTQFEVVWKKFGGD